VSLDHLVSILQSSAPNHSLLLIPFDEKVKEIAKEGEKKGENEEGIKLYLPFAALLRSTAREISKGLQEFKINFSLNLSSNTSTTTEDLKEKEKSKEVSVLDEGVSVAEVAHQLAETLRMDGKEEAKEVKVAMFTCRMCRKLLFTQADLASHSLEEPPPTLHMVQFRGKKNSKATECTSFFIQRVPALSDFNETEGKILCPKCKTRLGTYNWPGAQCSCGGWVVPALQITKSKVDVRDKSISF